MTCMVVTGILTPHQMVEDRGLSILRCDMDGCVPPVVLDLIVGPMSQQRLYDGEAATHSGPMQRCLPGAVRGVDLYTLSQQEVGLCESVVQCSPLQGEIPCIIWSVDATCIRFHETL